METVLDLRSGWWVQSERIFQRVEYVEHVFGGYVHRHVRDPRVDGLDVTHANDGKRAERRSHVRRFLSHFECRERTFEVFLFEKIASVDTSCDDAGVTLTLKPVKIRTEQFRERRVMVLVVNVQHVETFHDLRRAVVTGSFEKRRVTSVHGFVGRVPETRQRADGFEMDAYGTRRHGPRRPAAVHGPRRPAAVHGPRRPAAVNR